MIKNFNMRLGKRDEDIAKKLEEVQKRESATGWVKRAIRKEIKNEEKNN